MSACMLGFWRWPNTLVVCLGSWPKTCRVINDKFLSQIVCQSFSCAVWTTHHHVGIDKSECVDDHFSFHRLDGIHHNSNSPEKTLKERFGIPKLSGWSSHLSDKASKLCCVLMSTPDSQQPKPGWEWYLLLINLFSLFKSERSVKLTSRPPSLACRSVLTCPTF